MYKESLRNFGTFRQIFVKILQTIYLRTLAPNFPDADGPANGCERVTTTNMQIIVIGVTAKESKGVAYV